MMNILTATLTLPLLLTLISCGAEKRPPLSHDESTVTPVRTVVDSQTDRSFAVVELFTSEGCSSCPPADALLSRIATEARENGQHVYPLSFHVDYWNRLGWTDPFSSPTYSERQRAYADAMHLRGVYTPQMVVNGRQEFVGSDASKAHSAIAAALEHPSSVTIDLTQAGFTSEGVVVRYMITGAPGGSALNVALVERNLTVEVPRGENSGRTLHHDNVVRSLRSIELSRSGGGEMRLSPTASVVPDNCSVVAYVQNPETMEILGAARVDMKTSARQ